MNGALLYGRVRVISVTEISMPMAGRISQVHASHCNNTVRCGTHCRTLYLSMCCFVYDSPLADANSNRFRSCMLVQKLIWNNVRHILLISHGCRNYPYEFQRPGCYSCLDANRSSRR